MILECKEITLKNGIKAILKTPEVSDAGGMLDYIKTACGETEFLLRYPQEWNISAEDEARWIEGARTSDDRLMLACYIDGEIAGNCEITFMSGLKIAHRATVAIAVLKEYWGLGIATAMFDVMLDAARARKTEIVELEFIGGNDRARALYEKLGFKTVCIKPRAFKLADGRYADEFYMQKYI